MRSRVQLCLAAGLMGVMSTARANLISLNLGGATTRVGPNVTSFDTVVTAGGAVALDLTPGVAQTATLYSLGLNPTCALAVCNGTFTRGLNFGFVSVQDTTVPGSGTATYVQSVKETITAANTPSSSHALSLSNGGFQVTLNNGEHLTVSVPAQNFTAVATGSVEHVEDVSASFLLQATPVPEPSALELIALTGLIGVVTGLQQARGRRRNDQLGEAPTSERCSS